MTKRAVHYISGSIQRTGYRIKAVSLAKAFDITGIIVNLPDGRVKIIAEGNESDLKQFFQSLDRINAFVNITGIETYYCAASGEYDDFYRSVDDGETDEILNSMANLLKELLDTTKNGFNRLVN